MARCEGATFEIISAGKSCHMYDDPDADGHEDPFSASSPPQKYIQAVTGAKFEVVVTLNQQFQFGNCDAVRVSIYPDNSRGQYADIKRKDEDIELLGKIRVTLQRIYWGKKTERDSVRDKPISEVTEKVLKGKAIENAIKLSNLQVLKEGPRFTDVEGIPLLGPMGRKVTVNILYRSKRTLQMLGCIPRSPPPVPVNTRLGGAVIKSDDPQDELRILRVNIKYVLRKWLFTDSRLQARLAELEDRTSNTPQPSIKPEQRGSTSNVKREREDKENEGERKRSRRSGRAEIVDLTAD
ncbi:MAG: hypothetical protein Q9209_003230 [Squamulea sp. 1 TL-2023]